MFSDPTFWTAVGFVIFVAAIARPVWRMATKALDDRAAGIKASIDDAAALREEAQAMLAEYKRKQQGAEEEAQAVLAHAREEAARMGREAAGALEDALKRREQQALAKIAQAEQEALADVRAHAVRLSAAAARALIERHLDKPRADALVAESVESLPRHLN
ncbi:MAG: F0F1 ATP synthase subunit B [Alphaproteobacteria bacterium]|nr:F0F1 ATP synthase subunit B [Alphaproteobacteria bacterium]